jgi:hypothetical protein
MRVTRPIALVQAVANGEGAARALFNGLARIDDPGATVGALERAASDHDMHVHRLALPARIDEKRGEIRVACSLNHRRVAA